MLDELEWIWVIAAGVGSLAILGALSVASLLFSAAASARTGARQRG
jgi:hypothetical protein